MNCTNSMDCRRCIGWMRHIDAGRVSITRAIWIDGVASVGRAIRLAGVVSVASIIRIDRVASITCLKRIAGVVSFIRYSYPMKISTPILFSNAHFVLTAQQHATNSARPASQ